MKFIFFTLTMEERPHIVRKAKGGLEVEGGRGSGELHNKITDGHNYMYFYLYSISPA